MLLAPLILLPGRFAPVNWQPWIVISLALFWPLHLLSRRRLLPSTPLNWPLAFILLWLPVNLWASAAPIQSWEATGYLLLGVAFFVAMANWSPIQRRPELILWPLLGVSLAAAILGPAILASRPINVPLLVTYQDLSQPLVQHLGETINANILASSLLIFVPIWVALALRPTWTRHRWLPFLSGLVAVALIGIIALTGSRGSLLALAIVLPLLFVLRWPKALSGPVLLLFLVLVVLSMTDSSSFIKELTADGTVGGLDVRIEIWSRALYALHDFPFTGIGIGTFDWVVPLLYPYFLVSPSQNIPDAHNLLLQVGVDLGLPGLIAYLSIVVNLFVMLISVLRRGPTSLQWAMAAGILGSFAATLIAGFFAAVNWGSKPAFLPWLLVAIATLLHREVYIHQARFTHQEGGPDALA
jgi:putative inorganic carbon (HCO3(-)) transporter